VRIVLIGQAAFARRRWRRFAHAVKNRTVYAPPDLAGSRPDHSSEGARLGLPLRQPVRFAREREYEQFGPSMPTSR